jgi:nucleoporin GLE1
VPAIIPPKDVDGQPWASDEARAKVRGYRNSGSGSGGGGLESAGEYISRMAGMMRVYFEILKVPVAQPLDRMFQMPRYWMWFARMTSQRMLLETAVAAQLIYGSSSLLQARLRLLNFLFSSFCFYFLGICACSGAGCVRARGKVCVGSAVDQDVGAFV